MDNNNNNNNRNSNQKPGEKPEESRNNDKCRVASEDCTTFNNTHTQNGTRVLLDIALGEC